MLRTKQLFDNREVFVKIGLILHSGNILAYLLMLTYNGEM